MTEFLEEAPLITYVSLARAGFMIVAAGFLPDQVKA